jgi:hypothetical protein
MRLELLSQSCMSGRCPAVYKTDRGTLVVQGNRVTEALSIDLPDHETVVEIPLAVIQDLISSGALA